MLDELPGVQNATAGSGREIRARNPWRAVRIAAAAVAIAWPGGGG